MIIRNTVSVEHRPARACKDRRCGMDGRSVRVNVDEGFAVVCRCAHAWVNKVDGRVLGNVGVV